MTLTALSSRMPARKLRTYTHIRREEEGLTTERQIDRLRL
jgi:hypothetical protein